MHYYQKNIGDYAKKTGHLTALEHGVYNLLMDGYYDRERGPTKAEAERWARARTLEEKAAVAAILEEFFVLDGDEYTHVHILGEIAAYKKKAETAVINGKSGGRPPKKTQNKPAGLSVGTQPYPMDNPEETGSKANHKPITINQEPDTTKAPAPGPRALELDTALFPDVSQQVVDDFKTLRKQKKAAITKTAMDAIAAQAKLAGLSLEDALRVCCSRGWSGFKADWVLRDGAQPAASNTDEWKRGAI